MAGILSGQAAVDELEKQLGRKPTAIETQIAMEEGYSKSVYTDSKGVKTSGWGQTGENMGVPLNEVAAKYENRTQKLIPAYNTLPDFVKNRAFDATYRGTLGQSPMTVDLMNMGQYGDAADEFLNNQEYRDAVISGSGVAKRMEKTADAFREYGNQDTKQVVPKMNKVDPRLLYEQRLAQAKQAQQQADLNRLQPVPPVGGSYTTPYGSSVAPAAPASASNLSGSGSMYDQLSNDLDPQVVPPTDGGYRTTGGSGVPEFNKSYTINNVKAMQAATRKMYAADPSEEALMQQEVVPSNKPLSDANMRQSQYVKQQGDLEAKKASDLARYKAEYEAYASDLESKGASPKSFDRWKTEKTWEENNAQMAEAKAEKLATSIASAQNSYDIFINNGGNADDITIEEWSKYSDKRRIKEMRKADDAAAKALGGTGSTKDASRVNANIVPAITSTGDQHLRSQVDLSTVEKLEQDKKLKGLTEEYNKQGDSQYPEGMRPIADSPVPEVEETLEQFTKRIGNEFDDQQTDSSDQSAYSPDGSIKNGDNEEVAQTKEEKERNRGIFDKASELFGDIFTSADLKRMVLYTVGGIITGGSIEGSFQWAAGKIMEENGIDKQNQLVKDAADDADASRVKAALVATRERKEAASVATTSREKAAHIAAAVAERAAGKRMEEARRAAVNLADYNLNKEGVKWTTKAPMQVHVPGTNGPTEARWNPNGYWVSARDNKTPLARGTDRFDSSTHGAEAMKDNHIEMIVGIKNRYNKDKDDNPDLIGDRAANIYNKYLIKVDEWAEEYGYNVDLSSPMSRQILEIATNQSLESNKGKTEGFITPEHFFDTALLKGFVSSMGGSQKIFDTADGSPIDPAANKALISHIKKMQQHGAKTGKNTTIASALGDVHQAWLGLEDSERENYNNEARDGNSGFAKFALKIKIPKPKN